MGFNPPRGFLASPTWCAAVELITHRFQSAARILGFPNFPSEVGTPMWPDNLEAMFRKLRQAAGLPDTIKLHHLRHTLSTLLDECGATEALKAGILGHAKQTQTQKYTHARIEAMRRVLQAVEDRIIGDVAELQQKSA